MIIKSLGGAGQVTGSCHKVIASETFLLDCGLFQGPSKIQAQNYMDFDYGGSEIDFVLLSHGHLDHCGRLPLLVKKGFSGPIYTTRATAEITKLMLIDSAKIQSLEAQPLYTSDDVDQVLSLLYPIEAGIEKKHGSTSFSFHPSGHILGAHWIKVLSQGKILTFSGDLGRYDSPYYPRPQAIGRSDYLVLESTLGTKLNPSLEDNLGLLYENIITAIREKRQVLIPSFSIGRSQELVASLVELAKSKGSEEFFSTPLIVDSKLALEGFRLYREFPSLHRLPLENLRPPNLFLGDYWKAPRGSSSQIIISASGMLEAGPVLEHAKRLLPREDATVFMTGYQGEETLGRELVGGAKSVRLGGTPIPVKAQILSIPGLSGHGDRRDLERFVASAQGLKKIVLVHGEVASLGALKELFQEDYRVHIQSMGEELSI